MPAALDDMAVRVAAFKWLGQQVRIHGDVLPRDLLVSGFEFSGYRIPLVSRQGIFKPKVLREIPISITTTTAGPYQDRMSPEGLILYSYRGRDPQHSENVGLRKAMQRGTPLIYFHGLVPGKYLAVWPTYIVGDNPQALEFTVAADEQRFIFADEARASLPQAVREGEEQARRTYLTSVVMRRLHQSSFREKVLEAYREQCAMCLLRHSELLDAAHIIPDGEPGGDPVIRNGIALCKLHHAAFDGFFLGIRPDHVIEIRRDILDEDDGPMLIHGLQGLHGAKLWVPRSSTMRPSTDRLEARYDRFLSAQRGELNWQGPPSTMPFAGL